MSANCFEKSPRTLNKELSINPIAILCIFCLIPVWLGCNTNTAVPPPPTPTGPLEIIEPAGGEVFHVGEVVMIRWQINDVSKIGSVAVELSIDNGKSFPMLLANGSFPPEITTLDWTVEQNQVSAGCRIRVYEYDNKSINDKSGLFSISN